MHVSLMSITKTLIYYVFYFINVNKYTNQTIGKKRKHRYMQLQ